MMPEDEMLEDKLAGLPLPVRIIKATERAVEARRREAQMLVDLIGPAPGRPRPGAEERKGRRI